VRKVLREHAPGPAPRRHGGRRKWSRFPAKQAEGLPCCDFLHLDTVRPQRPSAFFVTEVATPRVHIPGVSTHSGPAIAAQCAREPMMDPGDRTDSLTHLPRDRDSRFTEAFDALFAGATVQVKKIPPRSPNRNPYAERFARSVRAQCLDNIPVLDRGHGAAVPSPYQAHVNTHPPHQGRGQPAPDDHPVIIPFPAQRIERRRAVQGLINEYRPAA
jgi:putative transposase